MTTDESSLHEGLTQQLLPKVLSYELFDYFCCLNHSQRREFILGTLRQMDILHRVLRTKDAFHIITEPEYELKMGENSQIRCFIAHYNANNSAAVWSLLNLVAQMKRESPIVEHPVQIIFTERRGKQGALAEHLHQKKLDYIFFVFDNCNFGDTLCYIPNIFARKSLLVEQDKILQNIEIGTKKMIHRARNYQYYLSDNFGLNLWNYPALLFSTLPQKDFQAWQESGKKPTTWENTQGHSFPLVSQFLSRLCRI